MFKQSTACEYIESLITANKLIESNIGFHDQKYTHTKNGILITNFTTTVTKAPKNDAVYNLMTFIYNDESINIHFQLDKKNDVELINSINWFLFEEKIENKYRSDYQYDYIQLGFQNLDNFNDFFVDYVWEKFISIYTKDDK